MKLLFVGEVPGAMRVSGGVGSKAESADRATELLNNAHPDVLVVWSLGWGAAWTA